MKNFFPLLITALISFGTAFSSPVHANTTSDGIRLISNLYVITSGGSPVLVDGTLTMYDGDFSNNLDRYDARKMTNPGENWGMVRNNAVYIVERRHIIEESDSVFFKMWNMRKMNYRLELILTNLNFPGRTALLIDNYLGTSSPVELSDTTKIDFTVNSEAASKASDRFRIIISNSKPDGLMPVEFVFSNAARNNQSVDVTWQAQNISTAHIFSIQRAADGIHFQNSGEVKVSDPAVTQYRFTDQRPQEGVNYYRISSTDKNGKVNYSKIMKVDVANELQNISVYPNPATADNLNLKISNLAAGEYTVRLMNSFGQLFLDKKVQYNGGTVIEKIQPAQKVPPGIYRIEVISHEGKRKTMSVVF